MVRQRMQLRSLVAYNSIELYTLEMAEENRALFESGLLALLEMSLE